MTKSVVVIGGGPGGLFAARLLGLRHPSWTITVYDRLGLEDTLGFGVGLSGSTLDLIAAVDPQTRDAIDPFGLWFSEAEFRLPDREVRFPGFMRGVAISRPQLRRVLVDRARAVGVHVVVGQAIDVGEARAGGADLVIAADGVSSGTRQRYAAAFGVSPQHGRGNYLWCGAETELPGTVFEPVRTEHGTFTAHAYPYANGRSTLVIETDDDTLANAGLDRALEPGQNDDPSLAMLSDAFAGLLDEKQLRGNRSQWFHFQTVRCARWVHENIALLGDAAATADPSLGSGTRLAMESAIVLADALDAAPERSVIDCLRDYDERRRPAVAAFQDLSVRSQRWWDSFPLRTDMHGERLGVSYLTRAGVVSLDAAVRRSGAMVLRAVAEWAEVPEAELPAAGLSAWILDRPLDAHGVRARTRLLAPAELTAAFGGDAPMILDVATDDPWGEEAAALARRAADALAEGARGVVLRGAGNRASLLDRLGVAERIRIQVGCLVGVEARPEHAEDLAAALVAGRIDFACEPAVSEQEPGAGELTTSGSRRETGADDAC